MSLSNLNSFHIVKVIDFLVYRTNLGGSMLGLGLVYCVCMCPESQQDFLLGKPQPMALPEQVEFQRGLSGELDKPLEFEHSVIPGDLSLALV